MGGVPAILALGKGKHEDQKFKGYPGENEKEREPTNRLAPGQASGVELLDISLQFCPYTQVSFDPVDMLLIPGEIEKKNSRE